MSGHPKIELRNVVKSFGSNHVLRDVSLTVETGESVTVIGGSGSGKSVMLKCILGLMEVDSGQILVDGEEITAMSASDQERVRAKFGMLFQGGALFDSLPVWRNVTFALTRGRFRRASEMRRIALDNIERVGLGEEVLDLRPSELSGGMQKRVALARAIAPRPEIIFFDEPTTGLDPIRTDVINKLITELVRDLGITALTITHDMGSVEKISDRVAMLYEGAIIWSGPVGDLRRSGDVHVDQFVMGEADGPID
ncbi:ATP-binding cassette domain-containing protein [Parasphingopyxis algicola]|uniref:ABC transporter ATP-binding protein n=1 Tax=Parasphingopyxis algicola TaxID=2026624 RepID=UPI0015A48E8E|nr:ATP-binding cassette domain-containing protein [Parasphingopyxis algicola]QLC24618.1 ATP-binding cassette domain-containing protein [Parasphingopyxis algicola]